MALLDTAMQHAADDPQIQLLATGGIYDRPLLRAAEGVFGATPQAFGPKGQARTSLVFRNQPRTAVSGWEERHIIEIWIYAPATTEGKQDVENLSRRLQEIFRRWVFPTGNGEGTAGMMAWAGQVGYKDDPVLPGTIVDTVRFAGTALTTVP